MKSTQTISAIRECAQRIGDTRLRNELLGKIEQLSGELKADRQAPESPASARTALPTSAFAPGAASRSGIFYDPPI